MKTKIEVTLKCGVTLPAGSPCEIRRAENGMWRCFVPHVSRPEKPYQIRIESAFRAPSLSTLEKWGEEGYCKAISGAKVEQDGICPQGSPSWMLAMGLI